ncbi:MAG: transposase [Lachnospiraceae bacterium]|nr:transposase [Lachnospiraceae bacterium]
MLAGLKDRGVKQVLLFASDGLAGVRDAVKRQFPEAKHQQCWVHLSRTVSRYIRQKDRKEVLDDLKNVYKADDADSAQKELDAFIEKHGKNYKKLPDIFERAKESLFQFFKFPKDIRSCLYTTNLIERSNKELKRKTNVKEQFPNEEALERFICCYYSDTNRKYAVRTQKGFKKASAEIMQMFEDPSCVEDAA